MEIDDKEEDQFKAQYKIRSEVQRYYYSCKIAFSKLFPDTSSSSNGDFEVFTCINSVVDDIESTEREYTAASSGSLQNFIKKLCNVWPKIYDCIDPVVSYYKRCLTSDQKLGIDEGFELLNEDHIFFCGNNADRLFKLLNIESMQCFTLVSKDLQKCKTTFTEKLVKLKQSRNILGSMTFEEEYEFCR
uniref:Uncharacterized protein LOC114343512 n=1 Tax=Diabrotica virgifera virgifera TaxID=50390 RepID=A0A6P7GXK3_DIAVI